MAVEAAAPAKPVHGEARVLRGPSYGSEIPFIALNVSTCDAGQASDGKEPFVSSFG